MTNLEMWALIVGALVPPVLAIIQQPQWPSTVRSLLMLGVAILVGLGNVWFNGSFDGTDWVRSVLLVTVSTIATYQGFWKPSGVAPAIETATSRSNYTKAA